MKKILATILALVLALGLTATVWADGEGTASGSMTGEDFLAKAKDGVITLTDNVTLSTSCSISDGQTYTINLNEHTLSADNTTIMLRHGKLIVNGTGTIKENSPNFGAIIIKGSVNSADTNYSVVEVNAGVILEGWAPIFVTPYQSSGAPYAYGVTITVNGATLNAKKDSAAAGGTGVYVNGQIAHTENAPVINLTDTTICDADNASEGMYLAGYAKTTLTDCDISGVTGIEIRAGELTVNGGSITGTATPIGAAPNGNGSTVTGAGIAVSQHTTMLPLTVTVNGSNVKGYSAFYQVDTLAEMVDNAGNKQFTGEQVAEAVAKITLRVNGGVYTATGEDGKAVYSENKTGFVSGGTFSSDVSAYAGNNAVASLKNVYYVGTDSIEAAVNSMSGGDTLTVIKGSVKVGNTEYGENQTYTKPTSYYYYSPSTTTPDTTKGSPKTFDAGVGIYAVTAVLSVTGMAWTAKKRH